MNIADPSPIYFERGIFKSDVIDSSNPNKKIVRLEAAKCAFELGCMLDSMSRDRAIMYITDGTRDRVTMYIIRNVIHLRNVSIGNVHTFSWRTKPFIYK
jgi:hypothetical protein